jgi:hypothetical protein
VKAAAVFTAIAALTLVTSTPSSAQHVESSAVSGRLVSVSARPLAGNSEVLYTTPARASFLLTQACVEHAGLHVRTERAGTRLTYGGSGCVRFEPALSIPSGERLRCENNSGLPRTCTISGVLGAAPERHTAKIIDVES